MDACQRNQSQRARKWGASARQYAAVCPPPGPLSSDKAFCLDAFELISITAHFAEFQGLEKLSGSFTPTVRGCFFFLFKSRPPWYAVRALFPGRRVVAGSDRIRFEVARHTKVCLGGSTPQ